MALRHSLGRCLGAATGLLLLASCATLAPPPVPAWANILPQRTNLRQVPYLPQEDFQCGPAALAMAMGFYTPPPAIAALKPQLFVPSRSGSLAIEMPVAARRQGFLAYPLAPHLRDVLTEVAAGHPVIVLLNLGWAWYPAWHYAVVIGYDQEKDMILLRHGRKARDWLRFTTFRHTWARSGNWGLVVLPPAQLPQTAQEGELIQADLALAHTVAPGIATAAWRVALKRWPDNLTAAIGLGNALYRQGQLAAAAAQFQIAVRRHPQSDVARNNLAQTLLDLGHLRAAQSAAQQAIHLWGPDMAAAKQTLDAIQAAMARRSQDTGHKKSQGH